ncbi:MAG: hypothetical protein SV775_19030 [Thermodesulfobacteriota bacterium]|nr:hypothetical protein [Thermodesulfobacteriota bacterium]
MKSRRLLRIFSAIIGVLALAMIPKEALSLIRLTVQSTIGAPGSSETEVIIMLENPDDKVSHLRFDICDEDNYLTLKKIVPTSRTKGLTSIDFKELPNGCAEIHVSSTGEEVIEAGKGPALVFLFDVSKAAPLTENRALTLRNLEVKNELSHPLDAASVQGGFIFVVVQGRIKKAYPKKIMGSQTKATKHLLMVVGEDTRFNLSTKFYFNPRDEIECLGQIGLGDFLIGLIRLGPNPPQGPCNIGIYTNGGEAVVNASNVFEIGLATEKKDKKK